VKNFYQIIIQLGTHLHSSIAKKRQKQAYLIAFPCDQWRLNRSERRPNGQSLSPLPSRQARRERTIAMAPNKIFTKGARPPPTALSIRGPAQVAHDQCNVRKARGLHSSKIRKGWGPGRPHAAFFHSSENVTYDDASPATGVCQERDLQPDLVACRCRLGGLARPQRTRKQG
jgi:hypothetical protein